MTNDGSYRSLFLRPGAPHEKYYGWCVAEEGAGLRVLRKRHGMITRSLVLLSGEGVAGLPGVVARSLGRWGTSDIIIHDFDDALRRPDSTAGLRFRRAVDSERLLNIATFVMDLSKEEDALLAAMSADYRRKIRKASKAGITIKVDSRPDTATLQAFEHAYREFAASRGLPSFDAGAVGKMYEAGDALLLTARRDDKGTNYLHLYTTGDTALFMYGVNPTKENDGAGQFLHWEAMRELRRRGFRWYDLGGVARLDPADGIFHFKEKFGGRLVTLGAEWRHVGAMLKPLLFAKALRHRHLPMLRS